MKKQNPQTEIIPSSKRIMVTIFSGNQKTTIIINYTIVNRTDDPEKKNLQILYSAVTEITKCRNRTR